jgi:hypothetical protein
MKIRKLADDNNDDDNEDGDDFCEKKLQIRMIKTTNTMIDNSRILKRHRKWLSKQKDLYTKNVFFIKSISCPHLYDDLFLDNLPGAYKNP